MTQHYLTESELRRARETIYAALARITTPTEVLEYRHIIQALYGVRTTHVGVSSHASTRAGEAHRDVLIAYGSTNELHVDVSTIKGLIEFMGRTIDTPMKQMLSEAVRAGASKSQILTYIHDVWRYDELLIGCKPDTAAPTEAPLVLKGLITSDRVVTNIQDAITGLYHKLIVLFVLTWIVLATVGITILKYLAHIA